jgi:hypothetical protein
MMVREGIANGAVRAKGDIPGHGSVPLNASHGIHGPVVLMMAKRLLVKG